MKRVVALADGRTVFPIVLLLLFGLDAALAQGQYAKVEIVVTNKKFEPAEVTVPANARIVILVKNQDAVAMEFESRSLKVEKVVPPNGEGLVRVGPLKPGKYDFFDDFNEKNRGTLIVE